MPRPILFSPDITSDQYVGLKNWLPLLVKTGSAVIDLVGNLGGTVLTRNSTILPHVPYTTGWFADAEMGYAFEEQENNPVTIETTLFLTATPVYSPTLTNPFSVSAWIQSRTGNFRPSVFFAEDAGLNEYIDFSISSSGLYLDWLSSGGEFFTFGSPPAADGSWHLITATYDGTSSINGVRLYVDGSEISATRTATGSMNPSLTLTEISLLTTGGAPITVGIADIRYYNRRLSAVDVAALYALSTRWSLYGPFASPSPSIISWQTTSTLPPFPLLWQWAGARIFVAAPPPPPTPPGPRFICLVGSLGYPISLGACPSLFGLFGDDDTAVALAGGIASFVLGGSISSFSLLASAVSPSLTGSLALSSLSGSDGSSEAIAGSVGNASLNGTAAIVASLGGSVGSIRLTASFDSCPGH